ncbi:glycosyltransferase family 2 protein [Microbacterium sp. MC2]
MSSHGGRDRVPGVLKVSVIVPTYRSGEGLDRLVESLDAQTMSPSDFEVIFVDDGSPDDTYDRLLEIRSLRPHVRVERIENSGWPSKPRNVGTDLARGEYVAYMDHDDLLYPDALRAAYEFAKQHEADVVNGKEARTHDASWAIDTYRADLAQSTDRTDQHPLIPMNPHKLYRRAFLDAHGIRFREGGRVMWEDIFFNMRVARHARTISTLASVPYYHWYMTPGSGSKGFLRSGEEFWYWLREVFAATVEDLDGSTHEKARDLLLAHQYRSRILSSFNAAYTRRPAAEQDRIYEHCRALQQDFSLSRLDDRLNASGRIRARLLAADARSLLERLPVHDPGIPGWGRAQAARWNHGRLELDVAVEWSSPAGRVPALRRAGDRILKALPPDYGAALTDGDLDVTEEVTTAAAEIGLRSRASRITWMTPSTHETSIVDRPDGAVTFGVAVRAAVDADAVEFGRRLEDGLWDFNVRCTLAGTPSQPRLRSTLEPSADASGGRLRVVYTNADGNLTLSLGRPADAVARLMPAAESSTARVGTGTLLTIPLQDAHGDEDGAQFDVTVPMAPRRIAWSVVDRLLPASRYRKVPAVLAVRGGRLVLEAELPNGWRSALVRVGGAHPRGRRWWVAADRLTPGPAQPPSRVAPSASAKLRRVLGRARRAVRRLYPRRR